jgi:hypothetical protein
MKSTHQLLAEVIPWAVDAAKEHVELSRFRGETPDPESGMGLWQSFQAAFPKSPCVDYDILVTAYGQAYSATVKALATFEPDGGRSRFVCHNDSAMAAEP